MTSAEVVQKCRDCFRGIMDSNGFQWQEGAEVDVQGQQWAWGQYVNGFRKFRFAICPNTVLIKYHMGKFMLDHEDIVSAIPGYVSKFKREKLPIDPEIELKNLHEDVASCAKQFLTGNIESLMALAKSQNKIAGNEMKNK